MKTQKTIHAITYFIFIITSSIPQAHASWNGKIINVKEKKSIPRSEFIKDIALFNILVIGEDHNIPEVQAEEGRIISEVVRATKKENQFSTSWEFLDATSQEKTLALFNQVRKKEISSADFLIKTENPLTYAPIIDTTAALGGNLFGVNISREEKEPVLQNGLIALDPKLLPPDFQLGGANYLNRFIALTENHLAPEEITNYFAVQCLVDDLAAFHLSKNTHFDLKFLIIGAAHTRYSQGVVERIKHRNKNSKVVNIEIINTTEFTDEELNLIYNKHKYGPRADYVVFVNEPEE